MIGTRQENFYGFAPPQTKLKINGASVFEIRAGKMGVGIWETYCVSWVERTAYKRY